MEMRQQMQSYYLQLQQFQMEKQRMRQSVAMRMQQEVQSIILKYQTYLSGTSPGGAFPSPGFPSPGGFPPGGNPTVPSAPNPYQ